MYCAPLLLAVLLCLPCLAQDSASPQAQMQAHLDAGRYAQAIQVIQAAIAKEPNSIGWQFNLAYALTMNGQDSEAIAAYKRVLTMNDPPKVDLSPARANLAQLLVKTGAFQEALPLLEEMSQKRPSDPKPFYLLGRAHAGLGDWAKSTPAFEKAIELDPKDTATMLELADVYERSKQPEKAAALYARLPDDPAAQERRGVLLLQAGDLPGAIQSLEAARAKSPTTAVQYALAAAYLRAKQPEKSLPLAEQIVAAEPNNFDMRMFYGRLLRDQKRYDDAVKQFYVAVNAKKDSLEAWNEFSAMLILLKKYDAALTALEQVKAMNGETPAYYYFRATMFDAMAQHKPALENYLKFLSISEGKFPDEEWKARQRADALKRVVNR